jgi:very-short-patch-repair endonuclease
MGEGLGEGPHIQEVTEASMQLRRDLARWLRRDETDAEHELWMRLRGRQLGFKFRRQYPIGLYIADFCCLEHLLVVELDGGQHAEQAAKDEERTAYLVKCGFKVLRFWNDQVLTDIDVVLEEILRNLKVPHPRTLNPPTTGRVKLATTSARCHSRSAVSNPTPPGQPSHERTPPTFERFGRETYRQL